MPPIVEEMRKPVGAVATMLPDAGYKLVPLTENVSIAAPVLQVGTAVKLASDDELTVRAGFTI